MAYAFKQIEAHDPNNPGLVAPNASVTIFEPGDPTKTPLTLTTLAGDPLPNPVTVNGLGYGPAFMHATLPQVAWSGGGLTGTFESYEGMRDEAVAARTAAETAAATAGADAVVRLDELIAAGEFVGPAGPLTNLTVGTVETTPGNPLTDEIIASEITQGTATTAALNATYVGPSLRTSEGPVAGLPWVNALDVAGVKRDDATVDNGPALSAAVQAISDAGGGTLVLPKGRYELRTPIDPKSNVTIHSSGRAVLALAPDASNSIIRTSGASYNNVLPPLVENFGLSGLVLDGGRHEGDSRSPGSWHALWLKNVTKLTIENVTVEYPLAFGALIDWCDDVFVSNWRAESDQINQDGIHFFDCRNVGIKGLHGKAGDDLLGISAQFRDIRGYVVQDVQGTSVDGSVVRINQTDRSVTAGETRRLEDMWFFGVTGEDAGNKGLSINDVHSSSTVRNINVWANFKRTVRSGLDIVKAEDSFFHVTLDNCGTGIGVTEQLTLHPVYAINLIRSTIIANVNGVKDGYNGVHVAGGNSNEIQPKVLYPITGFTNAQNCVFLGSVTDSIVSRGFTDGGGRAVQLGSSTLSTQRTSVRDMVIRNNSGFSIAEGTLSDSNVIEGNIIRNGGVSKVGANTKVRRNTGVYVTENTGVATIASGGTSITVNHGLHATPTAVIVTGKSAETADAYISSITSSQIQIAVPAAVTAAREVMWRAEA